jgi:predicted MPP superfamily phosphohydrolase
MAYLFIIIVALIQAIICLGHWFVYKSLIRFLVISNPGLILALKLSLGFLSFSFILASFATFRYSHILLRGFYTLSAAWLGIALFLLLAASLSWLGYGIIKLFHFPLNVKVLSEVFFGLALFVSIYGIINASVIRVTTISIELPNLPEQWKGKKAVWVSDTHLGSIRSYGFAKRIADKIKGLQPDIVFIGGDLYDGEATDLNGLAQPFSNINPPLGVYFITGNHEEFSDKTKYLDAVKRAGIKVLNNEMINLDGLQIIGVDYRDSGKKNNFEAILKQMGINPKFPSILLKHSPFNFQIAQKQGISLQLSGHTHQGQTFPISLITSLVYSGYDYGLKHWQNSVVYTSSGVGTWGPPLRVGTIPEIVVIRF